MRRLVLFLLLMSMTPFVAVIGFLAWVARLLEQAEVEPERLPASRRWPKGAPT